MIEQEFIPYEQALALKELGFNEPCLSFYNDKKEIVIASENDFKASFAFDNNNPILSPLYQQAFSWLLKEHSLYAVIIPTITMHWTFKTMTVVEGMIEVPPYNHVEAIDYSTYREAELECIKKLIEICKKN